MTIILDALRVLYDLRPINHLSAQVLVELQSDVDKAELPRPATNHRPADG